MHELRCQPAEIGDTDSGYRPPVYELARALEHYRRHVRLPIPDLYRSTFYYYETDIGEVMDDIEGRMDSVYGSFTEIHLKSLEGEPLASYRFGPGAPGRMLCLMKKC